MKDDKTGGPAFPAVRIVGREYQGMTLRDYFAIHCDQPGQDEIARMAGVRCAYVNGDGAEDEQGEKLPKWVEWYGGLSTDERFGLYARVRYALADAMLRERER